MTSYVLKSLLHQNTSENLVHANSVVRWLLSQRGPHGGFVTTQVIQHKYYRSIPFIMLKL